ncbi:MAG: short-chain dehydrogenase [Deltaproteobacteria bacterium CG2_30_63_29]|nr:MAG: short-chain dehydrogenase [Deltaproteobacteria bacterium CG2_30_63_29]
MGTDIWSGTTAVVTGASSGIGREIALRLARRGMNVAAVARRMKALEALRNEAAYDKLPGAVHPLQVDLRDEDQILELFRNVRDRWGGVDVLVNNAGIGHFAPLLYGKTEQWRDMLELNVLSVCICNREAIADMRRRSHLPGYIINIASMSAHRVPLEAGVYAASKHAVKALTEALRQELLPLNARIRVSAISPGYVQTEFAETYYRSKEAADELYGRYEVLQPSDIADAVEYLLSTPERTQVHDILIRPTLQSS